MAKEKPAIKAYPTDADGKNDYDRGIALWCNTTKDKSRKYLSGKSDRAGVKFNAYLGEGWALYYNGELMVEGKAPASAGTTPPDDADDVPF